MQIHHILHFHRPIGFQFICYVSRCPLLTTAWYCSIFCYNECDLLLTVRTFCMLILLIFIIFSLLGVLRFILVEMVEFLRLLALHVLLSIGLSYDVRNIKDCIVLLRNGLSTVIDICPITVIFSLLRNSDTRIYLLPVCPMTDCFLWFP